MTYFCMKYSYDWLKNLLGIKAAPERNAEKQSRKFDGVVVGKILEIKKHPNADRLQIAIVETHSAVETRHASSLREAQKLQIVCGAPNIQVGQLVPVATVGTKLPGGIEIKEASIRGVRSFGMLCAEDELGLSSDHSGIMILDERAEVGMEFERYINLNK